MRIFLLLLLFPVLLLAETVISVDSGISKNTEKNMLVAMGASAILPGMGEYYLGETAIAKPFIWVDASLWMTTIVTYVIGERFLSSAHNYAVRYAGLNSSSKSMTLLNAVGDYRSRNGVAGENASPDDNENYNQARLRAGKAIDSDINASVLWDWGSSDNPESTKRMKHYDDLLSNYRVSRIVFQVAVGALILNRIVSVLDAMRIYKATSSSLASRFEMNPRLGLDGEHGIDFSVRF